MWSNVEKYVASCDGYQRHKAWTTGRAGKLHPLPVPPRPFSDVALDFVGPLPLSEGKDMLLTVSDRLTGYVRILPSRANDGAKNIADVVFRGWVTLFELPERLVSDHVDVLFHPETDSKSERANKTAVQILRHATNKSMGFSPFELVLGFRPSVHPPVTSMPADQSVVPAVDALLADRAAKVQAACDALAISKVREAEQANRTRTAEPDFKVGDMVMVDSSDRRSRYKTRGGDRRAAKLFARWDGPYRITACSPARSTYTLELLAGDKAHPVFHASKLKIYNENNPDLFGAREPARPEPIDMDGMTEYVIEKILDEKGTGMRRYVKWVGYPDSDNTWEPLAHVEDTTALDDWEAVRPRE
ncbi:hypothetical protein JCM3770_005418 [Rhodotorula araucariae]